MGPEMTKWQLQVPGFHCQPLRRYELHDVCGAAEYIVQPHKEEGLGTDY